jgi:hypothetical protein
MNGFCALKGSFWRRMISQSLWEDSGQHSASVLIICFRAWCSGFPYYLAAPRSRLDYRASVFRRRGDVIVFKPVCQVVQRKFKATIAQSIRKPRASFLCLEWILIFRFHSISSLPEIWNELSTTINHTPANKGHGILDSMLQWHEVLGSQGLLLHG